MGIVATNTVHFATNREEIVKNRKTVDFGPKLNPISPLYLRYGSAEMMPGQAMQDDHALTSLWVAPESIPGITADEAAKTKLGSDVVFEGLRKRLIKEKADIVLLLHGYACDFHNALSNASQLKERYASAGKPLEVAVFAWPADGRTVPWMSYASDRDDARSSAKAIARSLLRFIAYLRSLDREDYCNARMHLVAHSMGAYALRNALQALLSEFGDHRLPRLFRHIFLMAPDEDNDALEQADKLGRLTEFTEYLHLYYATNDGALTISDLTKGNPDRLGYTGPRTLTNLPQKATLVDCSAVSDVSGLTDVRHQYYRLRPEVIADVQKVLTDVEPDKINGRDWVPARSAFRIRANA